MKMGTQSMLIFQYFAHVHYFNFMQLKLNSGVSIKQFLNLM